MKAILNRTAALRLAIRQRRTYGLAFCLLMLILLPPSGHAAEAEVFFDLQETIARALQANLDLLAAQQEIQAAEAFRKAQRADFLPVLSTTYQYTRNYEEQDYQIAGPGGLPLSAVVVPENEHTLVLSLTQPLFTGFALLNQYRLAALGVDVAQKQEEQVRLDVIFNARRIYFEILQAQKIVDVSEQAVELLEAFEKVAENYYEVGMTPLNDLLEAKVELANARQELIVAQNQLALAKANFNVLLRRPINAPVAVEDILDYVPLANELEFFIALAEAERPEIMLANLQVEIARKQIRLAQSEYYPTVSVQGNYYKQGTEWDLSGNEGIQDPDSWNVQAVATWDLWEWGKTYYSAREQKNRLQQALYEKAGIVDRINLQVQEAFLNSLEAQKNILTVGVAIEQAEENYRITVERFKEQMATSTDVLDARTLLSRTRTNYYNALYRFKISKAALYRASGKAFLE